MKNIFLQSDQRFISNLVHQVLLTPSSSTENTETFSLLKTTLTELRFSFKHSLVVNLQLQKCDLCLQAPPPPSNRHLAQVTSHHQQHQHLDVKLRLPAEFLWQQPNGGSHPLRQEVQQEGAGLYRLAGDHLQLPLQYLLLPLCGGTVEAAAAAAAGLERSAPL